MITDAILLFGSLVFLFPPNCPYYSSLLLFITVIFINIIIIYNSVHSCSYFLSSPYYLALPYNIACLTTRKYLF